MLEGSVRHVEVAGGGMAGRSVLVGGGVNVAPTVTAVVLATGVAGGLVAVFTVLICCRFCCADTRRPGITTSMLKRSVTAEN